MSLKVPCEKCLPPENTEIKPDDLRGSYIYCRENRAGALLLPGIEGSVEERGWLVFTPISEEDFLMKCAFILQAHKNVAGVMEAEKVPQKNWN